MNILHVMLWKFKNNKNAIETAKKICNGKCVITETGFQSFVVAIRHGVMNPNQDAYQTSIKRLKENWWNAIHTKLIEN